MRIIAVLALFIFLPADPVGAATEQEKDNAEECAPEEDCAYESIRERIREIEEKLRRTRAELEELDLPEREGSPEDFFNLGGALWLNYAWRDYSQSSKDRGGDFRFDLFRLDAHGRKDEIVWSAQYRFYEFMDVLHHGWIGYRFDEDTRFDLGVSQVPFGLQPYASHSYWFGVPYYIGFEDDYDAGVRYLTRTGNWDLQLAFFKGPEFADPTAMDRYSFDVVHGPVVDPVTGERIWRDQETNQLNARIAYDFVHGKDANTEVGLSLQGGQLYNSDTGRNGSRSAVALHLDGDYGPWGVESQVFQYEYDPERPAGQQTDVIRLSAFDFPHTVAAEGTVYVLNVLRDFEVDWGPIRKLRCYSDYSRLDKDLPGATDSELHTVGCGISAGPVYTFVDIIRGKNHHFLGVEPDVAFAEGATDPEWNTRFNINFEIYF